MAGLILPYARHSQPDYITAPAPDYADAVILAPCTHGMALDWSANANHLVPGTSPSYAAREHGQTLAFASASSQYLVSTSAIPAASAFTVFAWVRPANLVTGYTRIFETRYDIGFYLGSNTGTQYAFIVNNSTLEGCIGGQQVVGQRDFVCGVFDGSNRYLYINGVLAGSGTATAPSTALNLYVGRQYNGAPYWNGDIDTVGVFNRAFSPAEIFSLYQNPWQLFEPEPRRIWVDVASSSSGAGSATGTSTVSGVGASDSASVGSSSGVGAVSGVGASTASSVGSSSGTSTVDGVGTSSTGSSGSAAGTSTVSGAGSSTAASTGSASGVASVSGIGASEAATVGSSAGSATVSGVGDSTSAGSAVGTASGTSAVSGAGASTFSAVGSASGTSTVTGIAGGTPATGGHFAGDYRKNRKRSFERSDEIRRLILEQIEDVKEEIAQAEVPREVKKQARSVIKQTASLDLEAVQQELAKVRQMLRQFEQDDEEELLFMFH